MSDEIANGAAASQDTTASAQLTVQKLYLKDASFEAPNAPQIFQEQTAPELQMNLSQKVTNVAPDLFEVVLSVTLTCTAAGKTAYLVEVQQAGLFTLSGFDPRGLEVVLATYCPNVLFPYVRQQVSDMIQAGGFPPFLLQPINFEQIYSDQLRRRAAEGQTELPAGHA